MSERIMAIDEGRVNQAGRIENVMACDVRLKLLPVVLQLSDPYMPEVTDEEVAGFRTCDELRELDSTSCYLHLNVADFLLSTCLLALEVDIAQHQGIDGLLEARRREYQENITMTAWSLQRCARQDAVMDLANHWLEVAEETQTGVFHPKLREEMATYFLKKYAEKGDPK